VLSLTEQVKSGKKTKAQAVAGQDGLCASAVFDKATGRYIVKFVNVGDQPQQVQITFKGLKAAPAVENATVVFFHSDDPMACNTMKNIAVAPSKEMSAASVASAEKNVVKLQVPARTFAVYKF
jgi:alpha-L-arabinofuranosidase